MTESQNRWRRAQSSLLESSAEFGSDFRGDELPKEIARREDRLAVIQAAKKRLEERKAAEAAEQGKAKGEEAKPADAKPKPKGQESFTDPESRIMKTGSSGFQQSYNAQVAVDADAQIIVAAQVTQCANDAGQLVPVVNAVFENTAVPLGREGKAHGAVNGKRSSEMAKKLKTKLGRARYKARKSIVEPVF